MPKMEQILNQISTEKTRVQNEPLWISKIHLEYVYGQLYLSEETSKHCNFAITGKNMNGHQIQKKILRSIRYPNISRKNRQNIEWPNTRVARRYNISTKGGGAKKTPYKTIYYIRKTSKSRLEKKWEKKSGIFPKETPPLGHEISEKRKITNKEKISYSAFKPAFTEDLKSFNEAIQYITEILTKLSRKTDQEGQFLKKRTEAKWTEKEEDFFER